MSSGAHTVPVSCAERAVSVWAEFPGTAQYVVRVRQWLRASLSACAAVDDAVLLVSELATNALVHSASGRGGTFAVTVSHRSADVRIEVADQGGSWSPEIASDGLHGRGLTIVGSLARAWGITGDESGRTVWFELGCP
jgi:serine/threonine-protein kinase RsbW